MMTVTLEEQQWQHIIAILAAAPAPWTVTNPILTALVAQVRVAAPPPAAPRPDGDEHKPNSGESGERPQ